jgi:hypothetical protein
MARLRPAVNKIRDDPHKENEVHAEKSTLLRG